MLLLLGERDWHDWADRISFHHRGEALQVLIVDIWHPAIPARDRPSLLGGGPEVKTYEQIVRARRPLDPMNERQLSDGSMEWTQPVTYKERQTTTNPSRGWIAGWNNNSIRDNGYTRDHAIKKA